MGIVATVAQVFELAVKPHLRLLSKGEESPKRTHPLSKGEGQGVRQSFGEALLLFFILAFTSCSSPTHSQTDISKKALKYYAEGNEHLNWNRFPEAETAFLEAIKAEPKYVSALQKLTYIYMQTRQYEKAYQPLVELTKAEPKPVISAFYELAKVSLAIGKPTGLDSYKQWVALKGGNTTEEGKILERNLVFAKSYFEKLHDTTDIKIERLNTNVNTAAREYFPTITADGSQLYFTRHVTNNNFINEDIFVSKQTGSDWGVAVSAGENINTLSNEAASTISPDGRKLFFTICEANKGFGGCDIWMADRMGEIWMTAKNLGMNFNTTSKETQPCISGDGRSIYFVSARKEGIGMLDLWVSNLQPDGSWGKPENLGDAINTPFDEQRPFIHPDNHTLYFSSNGHPGFGSADVFMSKKDSTGKWQKPVNMGLPINSFEEEEGMYVSLDGATGYFASDRFNAGELTQRNYDIYSFKLLPVFAPEIVTSVRGNISDAESKKKLSAEIEFIDLKSGKPVNSTLADISTGEYLLCLETGKDYAMNISKEGYLFFSQNFSLDSIKRGEHFKLDAALNKIKTGEKTVLRNIFFETNSAQLKQESSVELKILLQFLKENPAVKIEIEGHTDNVGKPEINLQLSEQRAKTVYESLISKGIEKSRLSYKGFGESQPIASNDTEESREQNRRTEFRVVN